MFKENDVVVYGSQGVCQIIGFEDKKVDGALKSYFVLKPKGGTGTIFYMPTWNEKAWGKMRKVMTKKDVDTLIDSMPRTAPTWIEKESDRKEAYRNILASGNQASIISMIQALFIHKKEREAEGKRLHMSDEHFLKDAEQILYNEWQYVLNLDKDGLMDYILSRLDRNQNTNNA
jgi:CarD family transcriptional regulator